jgi:hypothetical protein
MFGKNKKKKLEDEAEKAARIESLSSFYSAFGRLVYEIGSAILDSEEFFDQVSDEQKYAIQLETIYIALIVVMERVNGVAGQHLSESYFGLALEQSSEVLLAANPGELDDVSQMLVNGYVERVQGRYKGSEIFPKNPLGPSGSLLKDFVSSVEGTTGISIRPSVQLAIFAEMTDRSIEVHRAMEIIADYL